MAGPPKSPFVAETARYRVSYGLLGEVATATVTFAPVTGQPTVRATGTGEGAVLGFGKTKKRFESEFNTQTQQANKWTATRTTGSDIVVDTAEQAKAGVVSNLRKRAGQPDQAETLSRATAVLDPLGLLLRLRTAPLNQPSSFEILDGRALWIVTLSAARPTQERLLQLEGRAEPIYWDGSPDKERTARSFSLYLSNDAFRTPTRLTVPFGMGEARAELVQLSRPGTGKRSWHMRDWFPSLRLLSARDQATGWSAQKAGPSGRAP